ncbi:MAG: alanine racemase [Lachnospiraceae bacterium]|nr:alanine racemase [Lachnospiraceae bacterium]
MDMYFRGYARIDLDNIYNNIVEIKKNLKENTELIAVIKTDGYGHGAVPIAKTIDEMVSGYAVATIFEGVNLRKHGITKTIFSLGYTYEATYDLAIENDIWMVVYNLDMAKTINEHAKKLNKCAKINIAIDTGMSRIGYLPGEETINDIKIINDLEFVDIEGIFTHFAKADEYDKTSAKKQFDMFIEIIERLKSEGVTIPHVHCANSAAITEMPYTSLDFSRVGISLYGLYPSDEIDKSKADIKPALSLHSQVINVKTIEKGRGVSYGHTYIASKDTKVATIPLGYGDGYMRNLSNKGHVIIKGKKVPIIGRVCMDQFMVDVTGMDVKIGDPVTLIGSEGDVSITMEEISEIAGTFNYEFACDLGKRIPRVYIRNGQIIGTKDYFEDIYKDFL